MVRHWYFLLLAKLWHSILPKMIVVYPHWKTMVIQAVKAESVLASPYGRTPNGPNGPNTIDLSLRLDLGSRPHRAKGSISLGVGNGWLMST
jgi:hypothetical protein